MAINSCVLLGRITHDLELKQTPSGVSVLSFSVAVERNFVKQGEERQADFIDCVAWRQTAEFISKFFGKGRMIALEGEIQTRTYQDKDGNNRKATEIVVSQASFTGEKKEDNNGYANNSAPAPAGTPPIPTERLDGFEQGLADDSGVPF